MIFRYILTLAFSLILLSDSIGQVDYASIEEELAYHADIMVNTTEADHRARAAKLFQEQFVIALNSPGSYEYGFESLKWISKLESEDKSFRLFSWIVAGENNISTPYGYMQFSDGTLVSFTDAHEVTVDSEYEQLDQDNWLGAIYYHMMPFTSAGQTSYLLFGYRQISQYDKMKVLDVLSVVDNEVTFGKELFVKKVAEARDDIKSRLILTYSADANVTMNYNESMNMIVFDHLISRMGRIEGQGPTLLPDGSFVAYKQEMDSWIYVDKLFHETSDVAPRPLPVLNGDRNTDILGNKSVTKKKQRN